MLHQSLDHFSQVIIILISIISYWIHLQRYLVSVVVDYLVVKMGKSKFKEKQPKKSFEKKTQKNLSVFCFV